MAANNLTNINNYNNNNNLYQNKHYGRDMESIQAEQ